MIVLLLLASLGLEPDCKPLRERVDLIELNHCFDHKGKLQFVQIIYWDWSPDYGRHHVITYVMMNANIQPPHRENGRDYVSRFYDPRVSAEREIRSSCYRETFTDYDPERDNLRVFDLEYRRGLRDEQTSR